MTGSKRYQSVETGETVSVFSLLYGSRHGAYSIERVDETTLVVNDERYELVTGDIDGG